MKYPTARKLHSGSWYCRVRVRGRDISITRPTEKEAIAEAMAIKAGIKLDDAQASARLRAKTVSQAIDDYIAARQNVLSPSTIRGYRAIQRTRFQEAMRLTIFDVSKEKWQQIVNAEAKHCSAKTLKNAWGVISAVILETTEQRVIVRLPQVISQDRPFLTAEQIPVFVKAIQGKSFEVPALLALSGLRRSEILALRWEDINQETGIIYVAAASVVDEDNQLIRKKETKNRTSRRVVPIIPPLAEALNQHPPETGLIVKTSPNTLWLQINTICKESGLPEVGVHGLRRSFASLAYHLGLSEEMTMRIGGWSDIYTMRRIYTKLSDRDIADQSSRLKDFFSPKNRQSGNENGDEKIKHLDK